ncbi:gastrula zinc finger protein XlCGF26.1 [Pieris rapae]|uniref:gastrula zinc finger protein XlCGF26.1 n=1 Tax=Pieris rapae TaxID=64459 RepID=UPI001E27F525|nr:gastrula zinc finger protein XlCGF26.1 [Pieris rapae]
MDFNELCRACLLTINGSNKIILFKDVSAYTYWFCTSIQILETEDLPKILCSSCYDLLSKFAAFKQKCLDAQHYLLNLKRYMKKDTECSVFYETREKNNSDILTLDVSESKNLIQSAIKLEPSYEECGGTYSNDAVENKNFENEMPHTKIDITKKIDFLCDVCNKVYTNRKTFNNHKKMHEKRLCIPCNKSFKSKPAFYQHKKLKHSQFTFKDTKCKKCGKVCKTIKTLHLHLKTKHSETNKYICDVCGKISNSRGNLKLHIDRHIDNKDYTYNCEQCNKQFKSKLALQGHFYRSHTGKQYICHYCNFSYKYRDNLIKHLLTHEGKKLHKCTLCNKSFSTRSYYIEHQRLHSGERPFNCLYCSKNFVSKRRLNDHHMIHTGERKHKCTICEQSFTQKGSVKRHMKIHNKLQPV